MRKQAMTPGRFWGVVLAAAVLAAGSGCVAFNVGKPEVDRNTKTVDTTATTPFRTEVLALEPHVQVDGTRLNARIDAAVKEEFQKWQHDETETVTKQKRFAAGFFPGAGECVHRSPGEPSELGDYVTWQFLSLVGIGLFHAIGTIESLVFAPFSDFACDAHAIQTDWKGVRDNIDAGLGIMLFEHPSFFTHTGLVGFHKYMETTREVESGPRREAQAHVEEKWKPMPGPYEVECRIPALGYAKTERAEAGATQIFFDLPQAENGGYYEAETTFRAFGAAVDPVYAQSLAGMGERTVRTEVPIKAGPTSPQQVVQAPLLGETPIVREVVREIHHYYEPEQVAREFDVEKAANGAGRTVWRVRILAEQLNAFDVDRKAKPQILANLRDEFAERNPEVSRGEIRAWATYTTEDGGRTLVYEGEASTLIPKLESLRYDAMRRRGEVTMRLAGGADLRQSKEFVRRNISAIVCDKNVVLTGERPPDGSRYRSLDENFADGVLTVEFEALE